MSIQNHYLDTAVQLLAAYEGSIPLHIYLKQFFSLHKKYGSRDRKSITNLCYNYFRLGKSLPELPVRSKIILGLFLSGKQANSLLGALSQEFNKHAHLSLAEKLEVAGIQFSGDEAIPFSKSFSVGIDVDAYASNFLLQQDLFIRVRPGHEAAVTRKLANLKWNYVHEPGSAIRLEHGLAVDQKFSVNKQVVIQDLNSQQVGELLKEVFARFHYEPEQLWDCCAASGGKSIMLYDLYPGISLIVSDIRQSILHNLSKRFKEAGITNYESFLADLSLNPSNLSIRKQDFILADVPCTGSGTWARTPEQLFYFKPEFIDSYAARQFAIANNAIKYLATGGWMAYVTCSVFEKENEAVIRKLVEQHAMELVYQRIINGTGKRCDSMFVAILRKIH